MDKAQRPSVVTVLLLVAHMIVAGPITVAAQVSGCRPPGQNPGYTAGYVGSDGKRHIRVGTGPGGAVAQEMLNALDAAMQTWNSRSATTNVVFEWGSPVDYGIRNTTDPNIDGGCVTTPRTNIWTNYNHDGCWVTSQDSPSQMATALEHEMGHFLGLEHNETDPTSGMSLCTQGDGSCASCLMTSQSMHSGDLALVAQCLSQQPAVFYGGSYDENEKEETQLPDGQWEVCDYTWRVTTTYSCTSSGCESEVTVDLINAFCYLM